MPLFLIYVSETANIDDVVEYQIVILQRLTSEHFKDAEHSMYPLNSTLNRLSRRVFVADYYFHCNTTLALSKTQS